MNIRKGKITVTVMLFLTIPLLVVSSYTGSSSGRGFVQVADNSGMHETS
jgi:hypothetical protein